MFEASSDSPPTATHIKRHKKEKYRLKNDIFLHYSYYFVIKLNINKYYFDFCLLRSGQILHSITAVCRCKQGYRHQRKARDHLQSLKHQMLKIQQVLLNLQDLPIFQQEF